MVTGYQQNQREIVSQAKYSSSRVWVPNFGGFKPSENEIKLFNVKNNETVVRKTNRNFLLSVLNSVTGPLSKYRYHFKLNYLIIELVFLKKAGLR